MWSRAVGGVALLLLSATVLVACSSVRTPAPQATGAPEGSPSFRRTAVIIETDDGAVLVNAEVADNPERRARGLMGRTDLADDAGMVFLFFEDVASGFWMKDTLIPLSIAFFEGSGEIVEILDMEPCEADPCPTYDPGVTYRGALEVEQGAFQSWGVEIGDILRVSP